MNIENGKKNSYDKNIVSKYDMKKKQKIKAWDFGWGGKKAHRSNILLFLSRFTLEIIYEISLFKDI